MCERCEDKFRRVLALQEFIRIEAEMIGLSPHEAVYALIDMAALLTRGYGGDDRNLKNLLSERLAETD